MTTTPVVWDYTGRNINLSFKTGFIGAIQDANIEVIKPVVGWYIVFEK
jgi:hypothetical protein